jgi:hypothetical protein
VRKQNGAEYGSFSGGIGDFFETVENNHQIDFDLLICCILRSELLVLFP